MYFWKTGEGVRLGLHAMYSTYEIKYFTPVRNVLKNGLLAFNVIVYRQTTLTLILLMWRIG
jgi:hypothetical protein